MTVPRRLEVVAQPLVVQVPALPDQPADQHTDPAALLTDWI
jgi:hypothetical protein